jgi:hypothetical protein
MCVPDLAAEGVVLVYYFCIKVFDDDGAGFYRFPAQARTKPNDVSPGHVIVRLLAAS